MKYKAWVFLILCNLFWAGNLIFGKYTAAEFPPIWIAFLRWAIALIFLIPMAQLIEKPSWLQIWKKNWVVILLMSTIGVVVYNYLTYSSLQFTSPINGALINSLTPALIMLFSVIFLKEKINSFQIIGLIVSFIGVLTVLTKGNLLQVFQQYNKGDAILLLSILFWTIYSLLGKKAKHIPSITMVAMIAIIGVLIMLPFIILQPLHVRNVTSLGITGIIYLGVFPSVGSFIFWNKGIKMLGAGTAGISMNLVPIFTAIIALILGQGLALSQIVGGMIVILGMLFTSVKKKASESKKGLSLNKA
ncbi:Threonine/homoserine efflux transporter RhtA [Paenibacillus sp. yr247]|uniref:DMT family transporter n=1 Tax=Paenibacillus sp. yr247 TaxID=1761880 RepID=UPI000890EF89|nr:DMT family transporter [Paenibacillus sp. yr247]SDP23756.1 Threonine/homoserine efflux transporter RhtA [Paenibacillus sp. yr247]